METEESIEIAYLHVRFNAYGSTIDAEGEEEEEIVEDEEMMCNCKAACARKKGQAVRISVRVKQRTRIARLGADVLIQNARTRFVRIPEKLNMKPLIPMEKYSAWGREVQSSAT